jgi:hypothetical protein
MSSLTHRLKALSLADRERLFRRVTPPLRWELVPAAQPSLAHLANPYPDWVARLRDWGIFGTFADYVLRKMLSDEFSLPPGDLIAEKGVGLFRAGYLIPGVSRVTPCENEEAANALERRSVADGRRVARRGDGAWVLVENTFPPEFADPDGLVAVYKSPAAPWGAVLWEAYCLAHLDSIFRAGRLGRPKASRAQVAACSGFFAQARPALLALVQGAAQGTTPVPLELNPTYGHERTMPADGDLQCGETIVEIKTVRRPDQYVGDPYQLLGYVALNEWLLENEPARAAGPVTKIAYCFPLVPAAAVCDLSAWGRDARMGYLSILRHL